METPENTPRRQLRQLTAKQQHDILRRTFTADPYAFTEAWEDGAAFRAELEQFHRNMAPEEAAGDRRRLAMAAYYCGFQPGMFDYAYDNFEQFSNKANGGKELDAWDDFDRVKESFAAALPEEEKPGFWSSQIKAAFKDVFSAQLAAQSARIKDGKTRNEVLELSRKTARQAEQHRIDRDSSPAGAAFRQGMEQLSKTTYNNLGNLVRMFYMQGQARQMEMGIGVKEAVESPDYGRSLLKSADEAGNAVRSIYKNYEKGAVDDPEYIKEMTTLPDNWVTNSGSAANWMRNAAISFIGNLPTTVVNLGLTALAGPASLGVVYGTDAYYAARDEGMEEGKAAAYGLAVGVINGLGETVTAGLLKGTPTTNVRALVKDMNRNVVWRFVRNSGISGAKESGQEMLEQLAENMTDLVFERKKPVGVEDFKKALFAGVPEAGVNAFWVGGGIEAGNFKAKQSFNQFQLQNYRNIEVINRKISELENSPNELSTQDAAFLTQLQTIRDAGNPADIAGAVEYLMADAIRKKIEEQKNIPENIPADGNAAETALSAEELAESNEAGQTLKLRHFLPHDVQDTVNAVYDTMTKAGYTGEIEVITTGWNDEQLNIIKAQLSGEMLSMLQNAPKDVEQSILSKFYPAFYHNGKVYINALSVRPSEVSRVLAHEMGLHYGMRQAFKGDIDQMLDWIYSENFSSPEMAAIIENYHLAEAETDEEGNPIYDGDGNPVYKDLSEENRRIAAEELLADLAETGGYDYRKIYADNQADIDAFAKENNFNVTDLTSAGRKKLVKSWIDETGFTPQKPNWFKRLVSNVRIWFHNHGIKIKHLSDDDIANIILRSAKAARDQRRSSVVKDNLTTDDNGARFLAVDKDGNQLFNVQGRGQMIITDIINDKNISEDTEILTDSGSNVWGEITDEMAKKGKIFGLDPLPIKLFKGNHGFGIVHIYKHLSDFPNQDLARLMSLVFGNIEKIYARNDAGKIKLEIFPPKARYYGILELRKQDGYYSVVSFFTRKKQHENAKGKLIWVRSSQSATSQATSDQPKNEISGEMLQENQAELTAQTANNINPLQQKINPASEKNPQKTETDKSDGNGALFSLESSGSEELKLQVEAMRSLVGHWLDQDGAEYARRFKEKYNITLDPEEAKLIAALAISKNASARSKKAVADNSVRAWEYFKSFNPLFDFITNFAGDNFKINPGKDFSGDEFTGTFIVKEFRDYSVKRRQKPGESDTAYRKYLAKREKALAKVSGTPLDEVAQAYARETGADAKETAEQMIDLLRHLNRRDIVSEFKKYKDEQIAADNAELEALRRAAEDDKRRQIEEEVATIIQSKSAIDEEFARKNSKVYIALQEALFPGQTPAGHVSKTKLQEINAAVESAQGDASGFIEGFRAGRDAAFNDYTRKLKEFREKLRQADLDRMTVARDADALLRQLLPKEHYSKFARRVIGLRDITDPKARLAAFDTLRKDIVAYADIVKRDQTLEYLNRRLQQLGRRSDTGRKAIGVRDEATQRQIDQIRKYADMSQDEVLNQVENLQNKLEMSENDTFDDEVSLRLMLAFGALQSKTLPELLDARAKLEELARVGREKFNAAIAERSARDEEIRRSIIVSINGGRGLKDKFEQQHRKNEELQQSKIAQAVKLGLWDNLNLWGMFDLLDRWQSSEFSTLARRTHSAARNEDTVNFRNADDLNRELNSLLGTNSALERADRIRQWRKVETNTGVYRYVRKKSADRFFKYTFYPLSDAKYLLEEYDNDPDKSILRDYQAEAVRHQLQNFDNNVRRENNSSTPDGVTEKLEKLAAAEEQKRAYDGYQQEESLVCVPTPDFSQAVYGQAELSQMQALSLWLYARQPTMAYKLHFNGFDNKALEQLDAFLDPAVKKLGLWMVRQLENDRTKIGEVYEKLYFTSFPGEENYFPAVFEHMKNVGGKDTPDITKEGSANAPMAYSPGALKQRVFHLGEPVAADALTVFQNHRMMMNHFVTHGETTRQLRAIFNNKEVQEAIVDQHGKKAYQALVNQLEAFIKGGNINAQANAIYQAFYGAWVRSKMAGNIASGIKQAFGFITYSQEIPAAALAKGSAYALRHPLEALEVLKQSDYFLNRLRGGANAELRWMLDASGQAAGKRQAVSRIVDEWLSAALRYGDAASVLLGGYATYKYHLDNLIARGVDQKEAHQQALLEMEMATERTQQSSKAHMLTAAQRSPLRIFTSFKSNQILLMNKLIPAIINRNGKQIRSSLGALVVSSIVMTAVGDLLRKGFDFDEYDWTDYIENTAADFLSGGGFLGALGSEFMTAATSTLKGSFRFRGSDPLTDLGNMAVSMIKISDHIEDEEADRIFNDIQKILTGAGLLADTFSNNFFVSSTAAVVREARRWWKLVSGEKVQRKKRKTKWSFGR